jgi:gamma-glutamylcyclotransferase (GGCT)/AIG2-like uncharacterized protein YtfP
VAPQAQGPRRLGRGDRHRALNLRVEAVTDRLFVYGTLAPGNAAWAVLEPWVVGDGEPDAVAERLYDTGRGYPGATFGAGQDLVYGVVVVLAQPDGALTALDRYEGDEYARITVGTRAGLDVATYAWTAPLTGCRLLADGRWRDPETRRAGGR